MVSLIKYAVVGGYEKYETNVMTFDGLSSSNKPIGIYEGKLIPNGSEYTEIDTGLKYLYDAENEEWYEQPSGGGGGGSGTDNYNDLSNKPQIAGITLSGNKSLSALGIASEDSLDDKADVNDVYSKSEIDSALNSKADSSSVLPISTKYAADISLSINPITFVLTTSLSDQDGNLIGTSKEIDLPLESMVVGGSYDSQTQKVVLTLKNGSSVEFSIADLVAGLQNEITASNKLSSDYVDDSNKSNKFVTVAEKDSIATISDKVDKVSGKGLSTNDYSTSEKNKLSALSGADLFVLGKVLKSGDDLNSLTDVGKWYATSAAIGSGVLHAPVTNIAFFGATIPSVAGSRYIQILVPNDDSGDWYKRRYIGNNTWQTWIKYTGTPLTQS